MKKLVTFLLVFAIASAFVLSSMPAQAQDPVKITMWTEFSSDPAKHAMDLVVEAFNAEQSEVEMEHITFASNNEYEAAAKAAFASGEVPDVVELNAGGWLAPYVDADQLMDLTDLAEQYKDNFAPGTWSVVTYKDRIWGAPFGIQPGNFIFYNKDILADLEIDPATLTTWSALLDALETAKQAGITPMILGNKEGWPGSHWFGHLLVRSMGVEKANELIIRGLQAGYTTDLKFTDPAAVRPWELMKELQDKGYFSKGIVADDFPTAYGKFFNGDGAFFQTGGWLLSTQLELAPDFPLGYMLIPALDDVPESDATDLVFNAIALTIPKNAEHPEAALKFIEWWYASETPHRIWSQNVPGHLPAMTTIESLDNVLPQVNDFIGFVNNAAHSTMFIDSLLDGDLSVEALWEASNGLFIGALSPQEAAENAEMLVSDWQARHPG
ncbi:MAG: extracellular solute-binding protein [Anaerolineales bacterium]|nr:extracellular solute-binding protein [Anaerolineales bacterium]